MTDNSYFIRIPDPELVELALLESSKSVLLNSKQHQDILELRRKKLSALGDLKDQMSQIDGLFSQLNEVLPERESVLSATKPAVKKKTSKKSTSKSSSKKPQPSSELDRINAALSSIERRLEKF